MIPLLVFLTSFAISYLLTIPTIHLAQRFQLVTNKRLRRHPAHTHRGLIPRAGGVPIYLSLLISALIFLPLNKIIVGILLGSFFLVAMGVLDDYFDNSPYVRFVGNILISALVVAFGLGIPYVSNPFGGVIRLDQWIITFNFFGPHSIIILANGLSILWLTFSTNIINWSKGVDGQLPGFVAITSIFLGILSQRFSLFNIEAYNVGLLSFIVAGSFLGFLPFNMYPQKIMPGYGGGGLAGFLLGVLAILSFGKIGTAVLILSIPLIDGVYTILRRLKNKRSPFRADWGHFHHHLLDAGWGRRRIAAFYWIISFILGFASLFLKGTEKLISFLSVGFFIIVFIIIMNRMKTLQ